MKRLPVNYDVEVVDSGPADPNAVSVIEDLEFNQLISGSRETLSPAVRKKLKAAMQSSNAKTLIFMMAYAQKSMGRLARIMTTLDHVEHNLMQPWRMRTMNSEELLDMFSELAMDRNRSIKEVASISDRMAGKDPSADFLDEVEAEEVLTRKSQRKVLEFFDKRVVSMGKYRR